MSRATVFDPVRREEMLSRLRGLTPETRPRWGRMSAPQMVAHLSDQMRHCLGEVPVAAYPGPLRWALVRKASIYWLPWPRGRIRGPSEAFVTAPGDWQADLDGLIELVERFGRRRRDQAWPDHALFGPMSGRDWGYFCYKHFDHHLRQFGQ